MRLHTIFLRYILFIFLQVFVFNFIDFGNNFIPCIYIILFIFPLRINRSFVLIIGFLTGYVIDLFENTGGIHAFCCIITSLLQSYRNYIGIKLSNYFSNQWLKNIIYFMVFPVFLHHFLLFFINGNDIFIVLKKAILNTIFVVLFILFYFRLTKPKRKRIV